VRRRVPTWPLEVSRISEWNFGKVKMGGCCCSGDDDVAEGFCSFGAVAVAYGDLSHVAAVFGVAVAVVSTFSSDVATTIFPFLNKMFVVTKYPTFYSTIATYCCCH